MKDALKDLEKELRRLVPRKLSDSTLARIERALEEPEGRDRTIEGSRNWASPRWRKLIGFAAAAVLMLWACGTWVVVAHKGSKRHRPVGMTTDQPRDAYQLVCVDTVLVDEIDEGMTLTAGELPARKLRYQCVDRMEWRNPKQGLTYTLTRPREEVRLVSFQPY